MANCDNRTKEGIYFTDKQKFINSSSNTNSSSNPSSFSHSRNNSNNPNNTPNTSNVNRSNDKNRHHSISRGKTLIILGTAILLASAIFVGLLAVILYNYFNIVEFDGFDGNNRFGDRNFPKVPVSSSDNNAFSPVLHSELTTVLKNKKVQVINSTKIEFHDITESEHWNTPTHESSPLPGTQKSTPTQNQNKISSFSTKNSIYSSNFSNFSKTLSFNFTKKLQKLKNCQATSFTSFNTHRKLFLVTSESHTDQVKIHEYLEPSSEFATIQVIFIRNPIDVKFLPEIKCQECAMLMIITESEVSFYKFSERDRSFVLESSTRKSTKSNILKRHTILVTKNEKQLSCRINKRGSLALIHGQTSLTRDFYEHLGKVRTWKIKFCELYDFDTAYHDVNKNSGQKKASSGKLRFMLSLHSHRERGLNKYNDLVSHHKTRIVISQLVVSDEGEVVKVGEVFKKRVADGTKVARLVKTGENGLFLVTSKGGRNGKNSKCQLFENESRIGSMIIE